MALEFPTWENASYHLDYQQRDGSPAMAVHAHPELFRSLIGNPAGLSSVGEYLGLGDFRFLDTSYGFNGAGRVEASDLVEDWSVLRFQIPRTEREPEPDDSRWRRLGGWHDSLENVLPIVTTIGQLLRSPAAANPALKDPRTPQLVEVSLGNSPNPDQHNAAPLRATVQPYMYVWLEYLNQSQNDDRHQIEATVTDAMQDVYEQTNLERRSFGMGADLEDPARISFDYPGDGSGFFALKRQEQPYREGQVMHAANNDYPWQQLMLLAGLGRLTRLALTDA